MKYFLIIFILLAGCVSKNIDYGVINIRNVFLYDSINIIMTNIDNNIETNINDKINDNKINDDKISDIVIEKQLPINFRYQETNYYCSCACVQMVLELFDIYISQDQLAIELQTDPLIGTLDKNVAFILNKYLFGYQPTSIYDSGYRVESLTVDSHEIKNEFYKRVIDNINTGYPTILQFNMNSLYNDGRNVNHQALIIGYKLINDTIDSLIIVDPYSDTAGIHTYNADLIYKSMIESIEPAYIW